MTAFLCGNMAAHGAQSTLSAAILGVMPPDIAVACLHHRFAVPTRGGKAAVRVSGSGQNWVGKKQMEADRRL